MRKWATRWSLNSFQRVRNSHWWKLTAGKIGVAICFDLRFADLTAYKEAGAEAILLPSAFTEPTGEYWEPLIRARAIETQCYIIAPNQVGIGAGAIPSYGHSMIVDPWGKVLKCDPSEPDVSDQLIQEKDPRGPH